MEINDFKQKVLPLKNKLYRFAKRMLNSSEDAEDSVQEVLIKLWQKRKELDEYRNLEAFAMKAAKNHCLDVIKSKYHKNKPFSLDDKESLIDSGYNVSNDLEFTDTLSKINIIVKTLPQNQKIIFSLRDIEGYEYEEISEILNMNINTIKVTLSRVRKKIRNDLFKIYEYEPNGN
jgi:RNA polymerase sigma factor (sigma-70 family)